MLKRIFFLTLVLLVALATAAPALAQGPVPQHSDPVWQATYWNNMSLSGTAALQRQDAELNFDWGGGSPAPGTVNHDSFSARWARYIDVPAGVYRFTAVSDDGMRVWVDGVLIINEWNDHAVRTVTVDRHLSAGHHLITVEYYENGGQAVARLSWAPAPPTIVNWQGEYFNNTTLSGSPALVRDDAQINFNWQSGSPAPGVVGADQFSARWTRSLSLPAGNYRFSVTADDGVRLWVNNHLLIDAWVVQAARTYTGDIYLPGGNVPLKLEYFENTGQAVARLSWTVVGGSTPPPPPGGSAVIVDNSGAGFVKGGSASGWQTANIGHGGSLLWTRNNDVVRPNYNWARWYPALSAGRYEVFVWVPRNYASTTAARYWVAHRDGLALRVVSQNSYSDQWVSLGTYWFNASGAYVSLADVTYETRLSRMIAYDAVKWEGR